MKVLGLSCFYHDSAAALIADGEILAAAQEERFSRIKHDPNFPTNAIWACLKRAGAALNDVDFIAYYDRPDLKLTRIFEQFAWHAPRGFGHFKKVFHQWLNIKSRVESTICDHLGFAGPIHYLTHHLSHAASAFYPSPFQSSAILTVDGVGEFNTSSRGVGHGNKVTLNASTHYPHSLGLLYSAFTQYAGFRVNSGEYKLMGLSAYGTPRFRDVILNRVVQLQGDGSFKLNMDIFDFDVGDSMVNQAFEDLFGGPASPFDAKPTQRDMDIAASVQKVIEEILLAMARHIHRSTGEDFLVMAGGVALNCVANSRLLKEGPFRDIWVQPAAGDAGGALGAAYEVFYRMSGATRTADNYRDQQHGSLLGPEISELDIRHFLDRFGLPGQFMDDEELFEYLAKRLNDGRIVGWFSGAMEFGPRALGCRSILADPCRPDTQTKLNLKIKLRESFRPFAPIVMADHAANYFETPSHSPYMLFVSRVKPHLHKPLPDGYDGMEGLEKLHVPRSKLPAITHLDFTARLQTVSEEVNPRMYRLLAAFHALPVVPSSSIRVSM